MPCMQRNSADWFVSNKDVIDIGLEYEAKALKNHKYYVKIKSLHLLRKAKETYKDTKSLICIDLGCGTGETTEYFQDKFRHVFACDYSRGMLEYAAKKNLKNVTFKLCQSEKLPFEAASADIVAMYGIIHHIDSGEKVTQTFNEVNRILKKGGIVAVYDFNPLNPISRFIVKTCSLDSGVNLDGYKKGEFPTTFYSWEVNGILKKSGFRIAKHEYLIFFPQTLSSLAPLEKLLAKLPLGGMYSIIGEKCVS